MTATTTEQTATAQHPTVQQPTVQTTAAPSGTDLLHTPAPEDPAGAFADRVLAAALGSMEISAIHLGERLGWYRALADQGPLTSAELAHLTGTVERYAREWLEHQATSGYLGVVEATGDAQRRRYRLHAGAAEVLTDVDSLVHMAPLARMLAGTGRALDQLLDAYRNGGGVSWAELGVDAREAQAAFNRPFFLHQLAQEVVPTLPDLHDRLTAGAAVADVGCGEGWSAIGLALGYPQVAVDGYDVDPPSIAAARRHAAGAGVSDRVTFTEVDAAGTGQTHEGRYEVVTAFECVHDMGDPVGVLRAMREMTRPDGYVLVVDERSAETFTPRADPAERLFYGFSLVCCLPDGLSNEGGIGTGTVMRPDVLAGYAAQAGFSGLEVLPVEHDLFRFYRLVL